jgi:hypothetical protein
MPDRSDTDTECGSSLSSPLLVYRSRIFRPVSGGGFLLLRVAAIQFSGPLGPDLLACARESVASVL